MELQHSAAAIPTTFLQTLALALTLSTATAASDALGSIVTYSDLGCVERGGTEDAVSSLPVNECIPLTDFSSFQGSVVTPCPHLGVITAYQYYQFRDCEGGFVSAYPPNGSLSACTQILFSNSFDAESALFTCGNIPTS